VHVTGPVCPPPSLFESKPRLSLFANNPMLSAGCFDDCCDSTSNIDSFSDAIGKLVECMSISSYLFLRFYNFHLIN
jgi:hypothetical protein